LRLGTVERILGGRCGELLHRHRKVCSHDCRRFGRIFDTAVGGRIERGRVEGLLGRLFEIHSGERWDAVRRTTVYEIGYEDGERRSNTMRQGDAAAARSS
jgi:hypothetical protein